MAKLTKNLRLHRLIQILGTNQHYLTAHLLAKRLSVTERTIYRDLDDLSRLGYPIFNHNGYKLHKDQPFYRSSVTQDDLQTLRLLLSSSPTARIPEIRQRCNVLLNKIESMVPYDVYENPESFISTSDGISPDSIRVSISQVEKAINDQLISTIRYHGLNDKTPRTRTIHPYALTIRAGNWYLIAFEQDKKDYRIFRLERIKKFEIGSDSFVRDEDFDLDEFFRNSWGVIKGKPTKVKIRLTGIAARLAAERNWPKDRKIEWIDESTAILTVTVDGTDEIVSWVMSMGENAVVLEPKSVLKIMSNKIQKMNSLLELV